MIPVQRKNNVKEFVKQLARLFSDCSLYPPGHPSITRQSTAACESLETVLADVAPLRIDAREKQIMFDGIPLYEIKKISEKLAERLEDTGATGVSFHQGAAPEELLNFMIEISGKNAPRNIDALGAALQNRNITHIVPEKTEQPDDHFSLAQQFNPGKMYEGGVELNKLLYASLQAGAEAPMTEIENVAREITRMITQDSASTISLSSLRDYDEYTFTHSVNVAILSVSLAATVFDDEDLLNRLAKAAILHDIGKTRIPAEVLNKPSRLTDEEFMIMKSHPLMGVSILEAQPEVDPLAVLITAQHHMKYDRSGYPRVKDLPAVHPLSMIVNICDVYDAMTARRVYKSPMPPDKALAIMVRLIGCDFSPPFFKSFVQMIGVYPPGCFVRLNTGEIAVTRRVIPNALLLPDVDIILNDSGTLLSHHQPLRLSQQKSEATPRTIEKVVDPGELGIDPLLFLG